MLHHFTERNSLLGLAEFKKEWVKRQKKKLRSRDMTDAQREKLRRIGIE